jgi:hypothetical protein
MSQDKMLDVFPIDFDFKAGELATEEKLSGIVKHTNIAFDDVTEVVGDPWDIQQHTWDSAIQKLSPERLSQANLARVIGPSDYIGPAGSSFNRIVSSAIFELQANRNSWTLGYPLIKINSTIASSSTVSNLTPLTWGTDIIVNRDIDEVLVTRKTEAKLVVADGDFFVDFYKGTIISYKPTENMSRITIYKELEFLGVHIM